MKGSATWPGMMALIFLATGCGETSSESQKPTAQGNRLLDAAMKVQRPAQGDAPQTRPPGPGEQQRTRPTARNLGGIADPSSVLSGSEQGAARPAPKSGSIIHRTTREVADAESLRQSGGIAVNTKVAMGDPITVSMSAYKLMRSKAAQMQIKSGLQAFYAEEGRYPKDFAEFKRGVLDRYNFELPALPDYQRYGYDVKRRELIVLEYPNLKRNRGR